MPPSQEFLTVQATFVLDPKSWLFSNSPGDKWPASCCHLSLQNLLNSQAEDHQSTHPKTQWPPISSVKKLFISSFPEICSSSTRYSLAIVMGDLVREIEDLPPKPTSQAAQASAHSRLCDKHAFQLWLFSHIFPSRSSDATQAPS